MEPYYFDPDLGWERQRYMQDQALISEMFYPVRCTHCRQVYDAGKVEVTARYLDCSCWNAPCCGASVDDRGPEWKSRPDIEPISR